MTHQHWCLSSSVDKSSGSQVRPRQWMRPITMTYSSSQASKIDRKCEYDQQPAGNSGHRFALYAEDLMLLCDKEAPNRGEMDTSGALPAKDHHCVCYGIETDIRIQSSCAICSQISGLSFDMGCPSRVEASSSPCHQRCLRLWSYKMWWMKAVKHQLYRVCQGPPHNHHRGVRSLKWPSRVNTSTGALIRVKV